MANRVSININVRDLTRAGLTSVRNGLNGLNRTYRRITDPARLRLNTTQPEGAIRRLARRIRGLPNQRWIRVNVRGPARRDFNRLMAPFRQTGRVIGGILSDGIGQGIIAGFQKAGPVGIAVFAAIIAGSLTLIGGALSGLIITALGLAFVGVGVASAATSKEVQRNWASALENLKGLFKEVGEPLIPVVHEAIHQLERFAERIAPSFRQAMAGAAPALDEFIDKMFEGVERFGGAAFDKIMDAFNVFGPVFGDSFADAMEMWGESFGEMADLVREHSYEIEMAIRAVFKIIDLLIDTVTFLGEQWVNAIGLMMDSVGFLGKGMQMVFDGLMGAMSMLLTASIAVAEAIPGVDAGPLKEAKRNFDTWRDGVSESMGKASEAAFAFDENMTKANRTRVLKADIKSWQSQIKQAKEDLKSVPESKKSKLRANIADLEEKVVRARAALGTLKNKTVSVRVNTYYYAIDSGQVNNRTSKQMGRRMGGVIGSAQTGGVRSNMTMVGEAGPELVDLPPGSRVRSNPDTRRLLSQRAAGGAAFVFKSSGRRVDDLLLEILREAIHQRGGDPVAVLGG